MYLSTTVQQHMQLRVNPRNSLVWQTCAMHIAESSDSPHILLTINCKIFTIHHTESETLTAEIKTNKPLKVENMNCHIHVIVRVIPVRFK